VKRPLNDASERIQPFVLTAGVAALGIVGLCIGFLPILVFRGVPFDSWPEAYLRLLTMYVPVAITASLMALVYGFLTTSRISRGTSAAIFGIALPPVVLAAITLSLWVFQGIVVHGFDRIEEPQYLLFLYALFSGLGGAIFWSASRKSKR